MTEEQAEVVAKIKAIREAALKEKVVERYSWRAPDITAEELARVEVEIQSRGVSNAGGSCGRTDRPCCGGGCGR